MNRIISEELYNDLCQVLDMSSWTDELEALRSAPLATALDLSKVQRWEYDVDDDGSATMHHDDDGTWVKFKSISDLATLPPPSGQVGEDFGDRQLLEDIVNISQLVLNNPVIRLPEDICDRIRSRPTNEERALRTQPQAPVVEVSTVNLEAFEDIKKWAMTVTAVNPWDLCKLIDNALLQQAAAKAPQVVGECGWSKDEWSETWSAGCGAEWIFPDGGPTENEMKFCPSCGKPVKVADHE